MHKPDLEVCDLKYIKYEILSKSVRIQKCQTLIMSRSLTFINESMEEEEKKEGNPNLKYNH